jgi:hypothetical protein
MMTTVAYNGKKSEQAERNVRHSLILSLWKPLLNLLLILGKSSVVRKIKEQYHVLQNVQRLHPASVCSKY